MCAVKLSCALHPLPLWLGNIPSKTKLKGEDLAFALLFKQQNVR